MGRAEDPHSFFADPDPAINFNADPDLDYKTATTIYWYLSTLNLPSDGATVNVIQKIFTILKMIQMFLIFVIFLS